jgi:hypothetical protein
MFIGLRDTTVNNFNVFVPPRKHSFDPNNYGAPKAVGVRVTTTSVGGGAHSSNENAGYKAAANIHGSADGGGGAPAISRMGQKSQHGSPNSNQDNTIAQINANINSSGNQ